MRGVLRVAAVKAPGFADRRKAMLEEIANFGYNATSGEYGDLVNMGGIDPTKVTRTALQNATSVAGLILTTDATVAEAPKEEKAAAPAMPEMDY